jgi:hypothetical protein
MIDYLTLRFNWLYRARLWWCKKFHSWDSREVNGDYRWERVECLSCGFWEDWG